MLQINDRLAIPDSEIEIEGVRAQGPGGQNVNKVASAVHLRFNILRSSLPQYVKDQMLEARDRRISRDGVLIIKAQRFRSFEKNRSDALLRLADVVGKAAQIQTRRKETKPTYASKRRRLDDKTHHGRIKSMRGKVRSDSD